jgi:LmbE family N-acetylglucosaminyl deacetylase
MKILVISVHPDDETAGCAGTLLDHHTRGDDLYWLILTKAHSPHWSTDVIQAKEAEVQAVAKAYGIERCFWPGLPSTLLDTIPLNDIIEPIRAALETVHPQVVYTVHHGDIHTDHSVAFQAVTIVLKPFYMRKFSVQRLLSFETLSSTEAAPPLPERTFVPNVFKDITPHIGRKIEIMQLYQTELQPDPLPRGPSAVKALARYRGAAIGAEYAEAFMLIREVI